MKQAENQDTQSRSRRSWFRKARKICCLGIVVAVLASSAMTGRSAYAQGQGGQGGQGNGHRVPEIDPGTSLSALTLLGCGALLLSDRRRRRVSSH